mgnify:CR=1 FL=1
MPLDFVTRYEEGVEEDAWKLVREACIGNQIAADRRCRLLTPFMRTANPKQVDFVIERPFDQNIMDVKKTEFDDQVLAFLMVAVYSYKCVFRTPTIDPFRIPQHTKAFEDLVMASGKQTKLMLGDLVKTLAAPDEKIITVKDVEDLGIKTMGTVKLRFFRAVPVPALLRQMREMPSCDGKRITKESVLLQLKGVYSCKWCARYHCEKCGLAVDGKDSTILKSRIPFILQDNAHENAELVEIMESPCDGGGRHSFKRNTTSGSGYILQTNGCRPINDLV